MQSRQYLTLVVDVNTALLKPIVDDEAKRTGLAALHPFKGLGEAEDIAKAAVFLASDDASWVSGTALTVDGKPSLPCFKSLWDNELTLNKAATLPGSYYTL